MTITKSGELASFYTVNKAPIKHLKVYFSPKQTGEGDPSPSNIRPIEGWNQINITYTGKNLFNINTMINRPGVTTEKNTFIGSAANIRYYHDGAQEYTPIFIPAGTIFTVHCIAYSEGNSSTEGAGLNPWFYYEDGTSVRPWYTRNSATSPTYYSGIITAEKNIIKYAWGWYNYSGNIWHISDLQFEILSTSTKYEPYHGITSSIDWSNDIGTIYGGYVDLITGELVQTQKSATIGELSWRTVTNLGAGGWATSSLTPNDMSRATTIISDSYKQTAAHGGWSQYQNEIDYSISRYSPSDNLCIVIKDSNYTTVSDFISNQSDVKIIYDLATPITYQLTPTQLQTFIGQNNIWSNADRVEIEYDLAESNDELYRRRNIILQEAPHIESISNEIANFETDMIAPLKSIKSYFNPIQTGNGDASINNIREIKGWNNIVCTQSKNLINIIPINFSSSQCDGAIFNYLDNNQFELVGQLNSDTAIEIPITPINFKKDKTYYVQIIKSPYSGLLSELTKCGIQFKQNTSNVLLIRPNGAWNNLIFEGTFIPQEDYDANILKFGLIANNANVKFTINVSETPFSNTSIILDNTIYGGYIDLINGEIVQTHYISQINKTNLYSSNDNYFWYTTAGGMNIPSIKLENAGLVSDRLKVVAGLGTGNPENQITFYANGIIRWKENKNLTLIEYRQYLIDNPFTICYELAEPIHYPLTPQTLKTFKGTNNIWSNANGPVEISYWTH